MFIYTGSSAQTFFFKQDKKNFQLQRGMLAKHGGGCFLHTQRCSIQQWYQVAFLTFAKAFDIQERALTCDSHSCGETPRERKPLS